MANNKPEPEITIFHCGPPKCDHEFNGPEVACDIGFGEMTSVTCSKCGRAAAEICLWEGP